jgi:hypothetical protein
MKTLTLTDDEATLVASLINHAMAGDGTTEAEDESLTKISKRLALEGNVEPMLVVSTAHLTEAEAKSIDNGTAPISPTFERDEGWQFTYDEMHPDDPDATLSQTLIEVRQRAFDLKCDWVMFDCDAPVIADIETHDW